MGSEWTEMLLMSMRESIILYIMTVVSREEMTQVGGECYKISSITSLGPLSGIVIVYSRSSTGTLPYAPDPCPCSMCTLP